MDMRELPSLNQGIPQRVERKEHIIIAKPAGTLNRKSHTVNMLFEQLLRSDQNT